jgi:hypothetical protein
MKWIYVEVLEWRLFEKQSQPPSFWACQMVISFGEPKFWTKKDKRVFVLVENVHSFELQSTLNL